MLASFFSSRFKAKQQKQKQHNDKIKIAQSVWALRKKQTNFAQPSTKKHHQQQQQSEKLIIIIINKLTQK